MAQNSPFLPQPACYAETALCGELPGILQDALWETPASKAGAITYRPCLRLSLVEWIRLPTCKRKHLNLFKKHLFGLEDAISAEKLVKDAGLLVLPWVFVSLDSFGVRT